MLQIHQYWMAEVVDVVNGETCTDLADFPVSNYGALGANPDGTPIVCGGRYDSTYYQACYKLTNGGWQEFASMNEKRGYGQLESCSRTNSMFLEVTMMAQADYRQVRSSA